MKKLLTHKYFLVLLPSIIFLVVAVLTLSDYGINWDSPKHFIRGQSYLHFILTGKHNFLDLPAYPVPKGAPDYVDFNVENKIKNKTPQNPNIRRSYFQSDFYTFDYFLTKHEHTHPEVNDLLAAIFNYIVFQKMGIMGDIEAYHLFIVLTTFVLMVPLAFWVYFHFGIFTSLIVVASLALYPIVFSETHFNIKDPVLMSFFGLAILSFHIGFSNKKPILIFVSAIFAGFALGTKFNVVFLPLILGPWLIFRLILKRQDKKKKYNFWEILGGTKAFLGIILYPFISLGIFFIFSPYLWTKPVDKFISILNYYRDIGIGTPVEVSQFLAGGWNMYPIVWVLITTPLPILLLSIVGLFYSLYLIKEKKKDYALLVLLWFLVPIARVAWPGTNIYGGVRQIMEFIPAMAILAGMGAFLIMRWLSRLGVLLVMASVIFVIYEMVSIHPNQNVYFNQLIGGLSGAQEKEIPSWGNTYGNVYLQGIKWLNENAGENAKLALPVNYISAIPRIKLRQDINLDNHYFSGMNREGEYAMEMDFDWPLKSKYKYAYYKIFLEPIYQVKVDGIPLLNIWKNDLTYTREGFKKEVMIKSFVVGFDKQKLIIDLPNKILLTRLIIDHSVYKCNNNLQEGFVAISIDRENFTRMSPIIDLEAPEITPGFDEDTFVYLFPASQASTIIINPQQSNSCILKDYRVSIWGLHK